MKHKHYDCIVAWAAGEKIEMLTGDNIWEEVLYPSWHGTYQYRIKKEPVIEVKFFIRTDNGDYKFAGTNNYIGFFDLKITYQDGKAIKAEVEE